MFPLQQGNELCFKISSDPYQEDTIPQQDLIQLGLGPSSPLSSLDPHVTNNKSHHHLHRSNPNSHDGTKKKKIMHREIERQRRQEMAARCASLRSLLPLEYVKGKRSISDHMHEAVKYIKHLQDNISVLGAKRDELKKVSNFRGHDDGLANENSSDSTCQIMVYPLATDGRFEILVSLMREQDLPLTRVLEMVLAEGLVVMSCSSAKVNKRLLHTIQAQVSDSSTNCNIDPSRLQEKLTEAIFQSSSNMYSVEVLEDIMSNIYMCASSLSRRKTRN